MVELFRNALAATESTASGSSRSGKGVGLQLYVVNVDAVSQSLTAYMARVVDSVNMIYGRPNVRVRADFFDIYIYRFIKNGSWDVTMHSQARLVLTDDQVFGHRMRSAFTKYEVLDQVLSYLKESIVRLCGHALWLHECNVTLDARVDVTGFSSVITLLEGASRRSQSFCLLRFFYWTTNSEMYYEVTKCCCSFCVAVVV